MQKWIAGLALVAAASACGVSDSGREISDMPWQTAVDSTGDTIQVRITGPVPDDLVRTLVTELAVGETDGEEEYTFGRVGAVLEGPGGGLVVYDAHNTSGLIRIYDGEGKYLRTVGAKGSGPGEYQQLNGLVRLPNGQLVMRDGNNTRLTRYAADGSFLNSWTLSMGDGSPQTASTPTRPASCTAGPSSTAATRRTASRPPRASSAAIAWALCSTRWCIPAGRRACLRSFRPRAPTAG